MIAKEGARIIVPALIIAMLTMYLGVLLNARIFMILFWVALFIFVFSIYFFRDPERVAPADATVLIAPADGEIVLIQAVSDPFVGDGQKVAIFMSPLSVHVNRAPCDGVVRQIEHKNGKFLSAFKPEASFENEQCRMTLENNALKVVVTQISGFFARRIVSRVAVGQSLLKGERFGMIMFGSRVEIIVPRQLKITARLGQKVRAGETVIGEIA
ncbi:MAG: phosphatidylserine decarboxylase family protein [Candidatus Neomarinimicrobiota bacterium]